MSEPLTYPDYSLGERIADGVVHALGVGASVAAAIVLLVIAAAHAPALPFVSLSVYGAGLIAVFAFSAGYHLVRRPRLKAVLRRFDHAAIFVMIAGTYTPFALVSIGGSWGVALLAIVWAVAALGVAWKLLLPGRFEGVSVALYLAQGWVMVVALKPLIAAVSPSVFLLLAIGGGLYTLGVVFHVWRGLPYHNAIWHALVLVAAGFHYTAVLAAVALPTA